MSVLVMVIIGVVLLILIMMMVGIYNRLVRGKNQYANAFAQIDVQLKRRYDLIPNLVETAKGYAKHEKETLDALVKARNTALSALESASGKIGDPGAMAIGALCHTTSPVSRANAATPRLLPPSVRRTVSPKPRGLDANALYSDKPNKSGSRWDQRTAPDTRSSA